MQAAEPGEPDRVRNRKSVRDEADVPDHVLIELVH